MLSAQENAWCVYTALFLFFSIILTCRCRNNILLIPFAIFGMLMAIGNICLLAAHYGETSVSVNWVSKSLVLSLLPAASVLVFLDIMEAQLIFIRHITTAIHNRDHWGSLYLREPEKKKSAGNNKKKARPWTYYTSLVSLAVYTLVAICSVILLTISSSTTEKKIGAAICVTLMFLIACFNTLVVISYTRSTRHVRLIRRNRDDMLFLKVTPILFSICMAGMAILSWIYCFNEPMTISITLWIVLESFIVYLPLIAILIMCIHTGKIKKMGRQYRIETDQRSFNDQYSYKTVNDIESVTKKISQEESNKLACPPPPAYQPASKTSPLASYA